MSERVRYKEKRNIALWELGTQPLLLLATNGGHVVFVDRRWNVTKLSVKNVDKRLENPELLKYFYILHFAGRLKPWSGNVECHERWLKYSVHMCSNAGTCMPTGCKCNDTGNTGSSSFC